MEKMNRKLLILAVLMALITTVLIYFYLSSINNVEVKASTVSVYVAKTDIAARTIIKEDMIMQVQVPSNTSLPKGLKVKSEIVGRLTKERIISGEPILAERLYTGEKASMAYIIPRGKRAVTIGVNEVSEVGNFVKPGDYVDVIATFDEKDKELGNKKLFYPKLTKVILQNIQVLGVGQTMTETSEKIEKMPESVTLAVTLDEAEKLVLSDESGVLRLVLRPAADKGQMQTNGVIRDDLMPLKGKMEIAK